MYGMDPIIDRENSHDPNKPLFIWYSARKLGANVLMRNVAMHLQGLQEHPVLHDCSRATCHHSHGLIAQGWRRSAGASWSWGRWVRPSRLPGGGQMIGSGGWTQLVAVQAGAPISECVAISRCFVMLVMCCNNISGCILLSCLQVWETCPPSNVQHDFLHENECLNLLQWALFTQGEIKIQGWNKD